MNTYKQRVPESEILKKPDISHREKSLDTKLLKAYLDGASYEELSRQRVISRGQVQMLIIDVMNELIGEMSVMVTDRSVIDNCLRYKDFWINLIRRYELKYQIFKGNEIVKYFKAYFKEQSKMRQEIILEELNSLTHDKHH